MKIPTTITWEEHYIPPRCRKPRLLMKKGIVNLTVKEVPFSALKPAFRVDSFDSLFNEDNQGRFIYSYGGKLWEKAVMRSICADDGPVEGRYNTPLEALVWWNEHGSRFYCNYFHEKRSYHAVVGRAVAEMRQYIVVDGTLYVRASEPRYCIYTFGLGHNHGGTALSVDYRYNPNIAKTRYFSALEGERAIAEANRIAAGRGDTNDVGRFKAEITVLDAAQVKVRPSKQHGDGDKFLNALEGIVNASASPMEAAILACTYTACCN